MRCGFSIGQGFSLLETLISISLIAVLFAISLPSITPFFSHQKEEIMQSQILELIRLASKESQGLKTTICLCRSEDKRFCTDKKSENWVIFIDAREDGEIHSEDQIIAMKKLKEGKGYLKWRSYPRYHENYLRFFPAGLISNDNATIGYCVPPNKNPRWVLILSQFGKTRIVYPNEEGDVQDGEEGKLRC